MQTVRDTCAIAGSSQGASASGGASARPGASAGRLHSASLPGSRSACVVRLLTNKPHHMGLGE